MGQLHIVAPLFEHDLVHLAGHILFLERPEGIPLPVLRVLDPDQPQLHGYTSSGRSGRIRYSLVRLLNSRTSRPPPIWCSTHALRDPILSVRRDLNSTVGLSGSTIRLILMMFLAFLSCSSSPTHPPCVALRPAFCTFLVGGYVGPVPVVSSSLHLPQKSGEGRSGGLQK